MSIKLGTVWMSNSRRLTSHSRIVERVCAGFAITHKSVLPRQRGLISVRPVPFSQLEGCRGATVRGPVGGVKVRPGTFETEEERRLWTPPATHVSSGRWVQTKVPPRRTWNTRLLKLFRAEMSHSSVEILTHEQTGESLPSTPTLVWRTGWLVSDTSGRRECVRACAGCRLQAGEWRSGDISGLVTATVRGPEADARPVCWCGSST